jgi:thiol-disulfide isomerase/thioredoxin
MVLSGIGKLRENVFDSAREDGNLIKFAKKQEFAWFSSFLGAIFLILDNYYVLSAAAALVLGIVVLGMYVDTMQPNVKCDCFGTTTGLSKKAKFTIRFLSIAAIFYIIVGPILKKGLSGRGLEGINLCAIVLVMAYLYTSINGEKKSDSIKSRKSSTDKELKSWQSNQFLGFDINNKKVFISDFAGRRPLIFIIAVTNNCPHCLMLLRDVETLSQIFRDRVTVVLLFQGQREDISFHVSSVLFDPGKTLYSNLSAEGSPFALLLDSITLNQVVPVAYGADKVRILFSLALNLINRIEVVNGSRSRFEL